MVYDITLTLKESQKDFIRQLRIHYTAYILLKSNNINLFLEDLENMKNSFKNINFNNTIFKEKEKCPLKTKYKIKKKCNDSNVGVLVYDKFRNKNN